MKRLKSWIAFVLVAGPQATLALLRAEDAKTEKPKPYPLDTCITDGENLGSMGKPYVFVYQGREIKLCCQGCEADFKADPAKYIKKLEEAEKKAKK